MNIIPIQQELEPSSPIIYGNQDFKNFKNQWERMDQLLERVKLEEKVIELKMKELPFLMSYKQKKNFQKKVRKAFRCNIVRDVTGLSFRALSVRLSESSVLQKFCNLIQIDSIRVPSKSTLEEYSKMFNETIYRDSVNTVIRKAREIPKEGKQSLNLRVPLNLDDYFADSTCVSANIHFPVDWVLLRDACRTFCKVLLLIRGEGLKNRMDSPKIFMKKMNLLCMEMTHCRRKKESKKHRKTTLRKMKMLSNVVANHVKKHRDLLNQYWESTTFSHRETDQILNRINRILESLPKAINQAHERIIGERPVASKDKLLSLYEPDLNVIVRGKAGAEVEFGNTLMIAEQSNGLVVEWQFVKEASPGDSNLIEKMLKRSYQNLQSYPKSLGTDRGFVSKKLETYLEKNKIFNGICPKNVSDLKSKLEDEKFVQLQSRRSQTEGRIAILKNKFLGRPMRSKGFENRKKAIASAIFSHNLWVLARLPVTEENKEKLDLAA